VIKSIKNDGPAGWAVHPGEMLREEFLKPKGISAYRLSVDLGVSAPTVNDIVREKRGITPEMAARLARYFGTSEQFWLNLQDAFAVHQVKKKYSRELKAIKPLAVAAGQSSGRRQQNLKGVRFVESHLLQRTQKMGHPAGIDAAAKDGANADCKEGGCK
jgi:addiction module HigA family antidote